MWSYTVVAWHQITMHYYKYTNHAHACVMMTSKIFLALIGYREKLLDLHVYDATIKKDYIYSLRKMFYL